jgi:hypothetical protein
MLKEMIISWWGASGSCCAWVVPAEDNTSDVGPYMSGVTISGGSWIMSLQSLSAVAVLFEGSVNEFQLNMEIIPVVDGFGLV